VRAGTFKSLELCTFEDATLCGYTQEQGDGGDWLWTTGSATYGPTVDHTYGVSTGRERCASLGPTPAAADGLFILVFSFTTFLLASMLMQLLCRFVRLPGHYIAMPKVATGQKVLLRSPTFVGSTTGQCVTLYYSMPGQTSQSARLQVYSVDANASATGVPLLSINTNSPSGWSAASFVVRCGWLAGWLPCCGLAWLHPFQCCSFGQRPVYLAIVSCDLERVSRSCSMVRRGG